MFTCSISNLITSFFFVCSFFIIGKCLFFKKISFHLCVSSHVEIICISVCYYLQRCTLHFLRSHLSQLPDFHSKLYYPTFFHIRTVYTFFFPTLVSNNISQNNVPQIDSSRLMLIMQEFRPPTALRISCNMYWRWSSHSSSKLNWHANRIWDTVKTFYSKRHSIA